MTSILITAAGIAACSFIGAAVGFIFNEIPQRTEDALSAAAAGIMLCAAILGLAVPSLELSENGGILMTACGIFCGAFFLTLTDRLAPKLCESVGMTAGDTGTKTRALLFVLAIAIHHFPEGIAAGVSFGTGDISDAVTVAGGIAFQNIPEGMVIIPPLLKTGTPKKRAAFIALISGLVEVLGAFFGYFAISVSEAVLPFALAFAAGSMLFVIVDDMVPQTHLRENGRLATYALLLGFCVMLAVDSIF